MVVDRMLRFSREIEGNPMRKWYALALCLWFASGAYSEGLPHTRIAGSVIIPTEPPNKISGASVIFQSGDGAAVEAVTNDRGEYNVSLEANKRYTVSLEYKGLCTMHRPAFLARPGTTLRFDFMTVLCGYIDRVAIGPDGEPDTRASMHPDKKFPYRDEETIPLGRDGSRQLIIAFGAYSETGGKATYEVLPIPGSPGEHLPVTISFNTYTVRADSAILDREAKLLKVQGNVVIADGTNSPTRSESCVVLNLHESEPTIAKCH